MITVDFINNLRFDKPKWRKPNNKERTKKQTEIFFIEMLPPNTLKDRRKLKSIRK